MWQKTFRGIYLFLVSKLSTTRHHNYRAHCHNPYSYLKRRQYNCITKSMSIQSQVIHLETPDKSENDKKQYKTIVLPNGLKALLVSDPSPVPHDGLTSSSSSSSYDSTGDSCAEESSSDRDDNSHDSTSSEDDTTSIETESEEGDEKLAACAVLVNVGSFSEPKKFQGLAHFLEHMIFMGSEKYPKENAFDAHIQKCGGFDNANTECEHTLFYFEVSEEHLDSNIDYFTALLKAPLMKKESMTRERDAVESEFQQTVQDDEARRDQLLASLATEGYPHETFTWGNWKSLKENVDDNELHTVLHEFRKQHYSAHRMVTCIQARLPIDELESLVVKHFAGIPSNYQRDRDLREFNYRAAFRPEFHEHVFFVKPVENVCKVEFTWVIPSMIKSFRCKPDQFISYLIGYEGKGSLCAYLRTKLWALELVAGIDESGFDLNTIYSLFNVCIYLTDTGFEHLDEVIAATFAYIKLFNQCGSLQDRYAELQEMENISFRFESQKPAFDNVQSLVVRTKYYPSKDILTGPQIYFEYDEQQIRDMIDHLNEFKFNIMITSKTRYDGILYDKVEKWFGTEYTTIKMPQKWRDMWENSKKMDELHLAEPNPFIASDFRLFWHECGKPALQSAPKKILQTDICELWYKQDDKFDLPEASMSFYFISPLTCQNAKNDILCSLYCHLIKYRLCEELYPATVTGISYEISAAEKGMVLKVNGYNEKLPLLVDIITKEMVSIHNNISVEQLDTFRIHLKKNLFNALIKPRALNKDLRLCLVEHLRFPVYTKYKCINDITLGDICDFAEKYPQQLYVQTLMQGNITEEVAHNVMNSVLSTLNSQKIQETKYIENRTVQLPLGSHYLRCNALNEQDSNTFICNYYQVGPCSIRIESMLDLLMMFVQEPLFNTLRTKEQLGYYVAAAVRINFSIAGYTITVNSQENKYSAKHVEDRIEVFRGEMLKILDDMSESDFDHVRNSLIKMKQIVDMSLYEEVDRNWTEIANQEYLFDRRRKDIEILRTLHKQDIIDFCLETERSNMRKLSVQVIGNKNSSKKNKQSDDGETPKSDMESEEEDLFNALANNLNLTFLPDDDASLGIMDIAAFKQPLRVYPVTKTKLEEVNEEQRLSGAIPAKIIEEC